MILALSLDHLTTYMEQLEASGTYILEEVYKMPSLMKTAHVMVQRFKVTSINGSASGPCCRMLGGSRFRHLCMTSLPCLRNTRPAWSSRRRIATLCYARRTR